ncbi:MAG TPA: ATP-binding protein [Chloroflexia bacterium]|nr:ATP-binding protein [Chloroflexia bacterium]
MDRLTENRGWQGAQLARRLYRVLLVEDQDEDAVELKQALNRSVQMRFEVTHVASLSDAARWLETIEFDVVLADLYLPDSSGPRTIVEFHERAPHVPVVALATHDAESAAMEAMQAGAEDYYVKGNVDNVLLVRMVRHAIERKSYTDKLQFLGEVSTRLAALLDYEGTLFSIVRLAVPRLADCCLVDVVDEAGNLKRVVACPPGPAVSSGAHGLDIHEVEQGAEPYPTMESVYDGKPELFPTISNGELEQFAGSAEYLKPLFDADPKSLIRVPFTLRGSALGMLSLFVAGPHRSYERDDLALAVEFAQLCALALDNALLYRKVGQALHAREDLLASVSHDLRTPLTSIKAGLGLMEMSMSERMGTDERQLITNIRRNVERLGILVNDLLTFSEIETHTFQLARKPLDLRTVVEDAVAMIEPLVRKKEQVVEVDMPEAVPYNGDRKRLEQVVVNLLDNAHKYAPIGARITVSGQVTPCEVLLAVRDDGPGIPIEEHEAIFERFGHGHPVRSGEGWGLGLAMARSIVEMHGGRIWVEGQQGEGATFHIALPLPGEPAA